MNIVLGSAFRNAAGVQIDRWASQCRSLEMLLKSMDHGICDDVNFSIVAIEGDSTDNTRGELEYLQLAAQSPLEIVTCNHGQRVFGSTEETDRLAALSQVGNAILSGVNESDDILIYVESDLIWDAKTIVSLIRTLYSCELDVIAPLIFAGDTFYDVFVYRGLDGERFSPFFPYHWSLAATQQEIDWSKSKNPFREMPVEVESVGSCLVMLGEVARKCRIRNDQALLGFCKDVREKGYHIWVDPTQRIYHP